MNKMKQSTRRQFIKSTAGVTAAAIVVPYSAGDEAKSVNNSAHDKIDRKAVVERHNIVITKTNPRSPAQAGNGKFAFGMDITGLQSFVAFNTLSDWGWHSAPLPSGMSPDDFQEPIIETHGRPVPYYNANPKQPELSAWLAGNPHRFNLGRIGLRLIKSDGKDATEQDLENPVQKTDLWTGVVESRFQLEGKNVAVKTVCHPELDMIGIEIQSELLAAGKISLFLDFPYANAQNSGNYIGVYSNPSAHTSTITNTSSSAVISREMDDARYRVSLAWEQKARIERESPTTHRFHLKPETTGNFSLTVHFHEKETADANQWTVGKITESSVKSWQDYWLSGAAIDLSASKDNRWKELERRVVLSQYLMRINEAGLFPPQEAGLVNNGWYGRFHFEMVWWHGVHYGLWNRWELFDKYLRVYQKFLPTSIDRAKKQGYKGARWAKCTANFDRDWPHPIHATLIWQQPHPIYFAEMDYRLHPNRQTLDKWKEVVFNTADFMADYAFYDESKGEYVLGPPLFLVSENTNMMTTQNPAFELGYWRYGLRTALEWRKRLELPEQPEWRKVLDKLSPLPVQEGFYVTHENIRLMWTKFNFEHPALIGTYGMLPGDGADKEIFVKTLEKVVSVWNMNRTWGWDFPMIAMAAARTGKTGLAIDMLTHPAGGFQFDEHGFSTGGPFPYFPSNGGLLTAIAMMCGGWDGSATGECPGFPKDGNWTVKAEGFVKMQ
jgi:hypothetical protein